MPGPRKPLNMPKLTEQQQFIAVISVAAFCGLVASLSTFHFLRHQQAHPTPQQAAEDGVSVVVARQDLAPGSAIGQLAIEAAPWPRSSQPPHSFTDLHDVEGRQVMTKIYRGEPIVESRLVPKGEHGGLHVRIPEGMLAMSIKVDPEIGVSGFIQPGDRVDVIATLKAQRDDAVTKIVLQNILVLASGHEMDSQNAKPDDVGTVTLALTPKEAERLASSRTQGEFMLALRNLGDERTYETQGFRVSEVLEARVGRPKSASADAQRGEAASAEGNAGETAEGAATEHGEAAHPSDGAAPSQEGVTANREEATMGRSRQPRSAAMKKTGPAVQVEEPKKGPMVQLIQAGKITELNFPNNK